ncbi:arginase [Helicobacter suis]|uniref:Arginase n=1 Tax=Helicobacter suis TaxID=104628 RepID=A0A6J4D185_9HELI|nr:arginase [Helicobacter suis]BCD46223.1 Arginase RocF [Helicobacter suis]BCD47861.1 Arginase RocF [Helicobacter suis]BCD49621.1 Arginase RocF [Helicobacter suis]BCD50899.1 Arginase RocF [Helicobacter suis]BCD70560.1 Arginase RocF [Helicobacter suis]
MQHHFILVALNAEMGGAKQGSNTGVERLKKALLQKYPQMETITIGQEECTLNTFFKYAEHFEDYYCFCKFLLIPGLQEVFKKQCFSLILSSEHANAFGIIQALRSTHPQKKLGILYLDAHADIHTAYDSHSRHIHGMPLGMVLNHVHSGPNPLNQQEQEYWQKLCALGMQDGVLAFDPKHLVYFGVRSTELSERNVIKECAIPLFSVDAIRADMKGVLEQSQALLKGVDILYLSLDVDILDGKLFSSTGVRENNGLQPSELLALLEGLLQTFKTRLAAAEITEYNPELYTGEGEDEKVVLKLAQSVLNHFNKEFA